MKLGNSDFLLELDESSALDVQAAFIGNADISPGHAVPDDGDSRIFRAVQGFMFTCGPDHVRHPEPVEGRPGMTYPLHGSMSGHRPEIIRHISDESRQVVEAVIPVKMLTGHEADIRRIWRFDAAAAAFSLEDELTNIGSEAFAPMWMYHINFGTHIFSGDTRLNSASFDAGEIGWRFGPGEGHVFCVPSRGEDGEAHVRVGPISGAGGKSVAVSYGIDTLPHLQMWRNEAGHCAVIGVEPISHPWRRRDELARDGLLETLKPGQKKRFAARFALVD